MIDRSSGRSVRRREFVGGLLGAGLGLLFGRSGHAQAPREWVPSGTAAPWDERLEAAITVELPNHLRRPYVAIYIEAADGSAVRTLALWLQKLRRPWILGLRRYPRQEVMRQERDGGGNLIATISSPTRRAGTYTVVWDGRTDAGGLVEQGQYFVCVEVVRQSGSYQLIRKDFVFGSQPFKVDLGSNVEITAATLDFRAKRG